ncbi:GntR family transcriptional regulator [Gracilibacillus massiliensis]|uniref:GntR family transcriptional regulator n=1 Tax=Gracilibacillus massiliensis TaxID=1564956 RepID=UPI00071C4CCE|nr:GntR family transcriptional regulator [Gracilibacillus massiliensis]
MIDKNSPLPIYYQIEQEIREQIKSGKLKPGQLLPSERVYTERYNISRMTIRQALHTLTSEGLLVREKGRGTFVAEQKLNHHLTGITSFSEEMHQKGLQATSEIIAFEKVPAPHNIAEHLQINQSEEIYMIKRLRKADNIPIAFEISYIPVAIAKGLNEEEMTRSFYRYIEEELNYIISHGEQEIEATLAKEVESNLLQIEKDSPILLIHRLTYIKGDIPFEYVQTSYRADKYKYSVQLPRTE